MIDGPPFATGIRKAAVCRCRKVSLLTTQVRVATNDKMRIKISPELTYNVTSWVPTSKKENQMKSLSN